MNTSTLVGKALVVTAMYMAVTFSCYSAENTAYESEIRCCFQVNDLDGKFTIMLTNIRDTVSYLTVTTPDNKRYGYIKELDKYTVPIPGYAYALEPPEGSPLYYPDEHKGSNSVFLLSNLMPGRYTVEVTSLRSGGYYLSFYPISMQISAGTKIISDHNKPIPIKQGEVHVYHFNGDYTNPYDASIPDNDPHVFRVIREK